MLSQITYPTEPIEIVGAHHAFLLGSKFFAEFSEALSQVTRRPH